MNEQVRNWLCSHSDFAGVSEENIRFIPFHERLDKNKSDEVMDKLREARREILGKGVKLIHLFYRGPLAIATMIGAELSNGCPVLFYQNDSKGTDGYVN